MHTTMSYGGVPCGNIFWQSRLLLYILIGGKYLQDEDFVAEKDDEGSPTDDSGADDSDASQSGDEKEACDLFYVPLLSCDASPLLFTSLVFLTP